MTCAVLSAVGAHRRIGGIAFSPHLSPSQTTKGLGIMGLKTTGYSLPYLKFLTRHQHELRTHWHSLAALEYAQRWLVALPQPNVDERLTAYPGDNRQPFISIDITPSKYLSYAAGVSASLSERTLVLLVTVFETYIFDAIQRRVLEKRLVQEVIGDNDQVLLAQELFIRTGVSDPKRLSAAVSKCMGSNMKTNKAEEAVAAQRRGKTLDHGFSFIEEMLPSI